jgi:hypothetical protein
MGDVRYPQGGTPNWVWYAVVLIILWAYFRKSEPGSSVANPSGDSKEETAGAPPTTDPPESPRFPAVFSFSDGSMALQVRVEPGTAPDEYILHIPDRDAKITPSTVRLTTREDLGQRVAENQVVLGPGGGMWAPDHGAFIIAFTGRGEEWFSIGNDLGEVKTLNVLF